MTAGELRMTAGELRMTAGELRMTAGELRMTAGELRMTAGELRMTARERRMTAGELRMTVREVWVFMTRMRTKSTSISERRLPGQRDMRSGEPHEVGEYRRSEMLKFHPSREGIFPRIQPTPLRGLAKCPGCCLIGSSADPRSTRPVNSIV
jgi:hypothetical protein